MHQKNDPPIMDVAPNKMGVYEVVEKKYTVKVGKEIGSIRLWLIVQYNRFFSPP